MKKTTLMLGLLCGLNYLPANAQTTPAEKTLINNPATLIVLDDETDELFDNDSYMYSVPETQKTIAQLNIPDPLWLYNLWNEVNSYHIEYWVSNGRLYWKVVRNN